MHGQRVDLALENGHSGFIDDGPNVWNDCVAEYLVNKAMVTLIPNRRDVLHRQTVVKLWNVNSKK